MSTSNLLPAGESPAFIVGCARSGTSVLGEIVAAHPLVDYVWEAHELWENTAGLGPDGSHRLGSDAASARVRDSLQRAFPSQLGRLTVEKNPRNTLRVPFLKAVFPDARIIHIVRDGRDVACSLVPGCGGHEWRHLKPPAWRTLMDSWGGIERCARIWREVLEIALADLTRVSHLQIRYEDLVSSPGDAISAVFEYLELPPSEEASDFATRISDVVEGSYIAARQSVWSRPDHKRRIGRFRENLTLEEQRRLTSLLAPLLERLGYASTL